MAVALCGVFPFGRTVGFLAQVARPRPYGKNNIELSQINGEAIRGTVKPARSNTGRPKGKAKMGYDGGLFWDGGFQGGRSPTGLLDFAKQRHIDILPRINLWDSGSSKDARRSRFYSFSPKG